MITIDTGDVVFHRPTGEEWLVGRVDRDSLYWLGWPPGRAQVKDCLLVDKATREGREKLLMEIACSHHSLAQYAQDRLGNRFYDIGWQHRPKDAPTTREVQS